MTNKEKDLEPERKKITQRILEQYGIENIDRPALFFLFYLGTIIYSTIFVKGLFDGEKFFSIKLLLFILIMSLVFFVFYTEKKKSREK